MCFSFWGMNNTVVYGHFFIKRIYFHFRYINGKSQYNYISYLGRLWTNFDGVCRPVTSVTSSIVEYGVIFTVVNKARNSARPTWHHIMGPMYSAIFEWVSMWSSYLVRGRGWTQPFKSTPARTERYRNASAFKNFRTAASRKFTFYAIRGINPKMRTPDRTKGSQGVDLVTDFRTGGSRKIEFGGRVRTQEPLPQQGTHRVGQKVLRGAI